MPDNRCYKCGYNHADFPELPISAGYKGHPHEKDTPCWCGAWHKDDDFPVMVRVLE